MCTVTYYPKEQGGFTLTSNRDERGDRPLAKNPEKYQVFNEEVVFPKDPEGGGTWVATSKLNTLCLLNGADIFHHKGGPYRKSRGLVLLDFFKFNDVREFSKIENFENIEPFTLIVVQHQDRKLFQVRWNGKIIKLEELDAKRPYIWSSYTLYTEEVIAQREAWFLDFIKEQNLTADQLLYFHRFGGTGNIEHDLVMSRIGKVQTVSITQVNFQKEHSMIHFDLLQQNQTKVYVE